MASQKTSGLSLTKKANDIFKGFVQKTRRIFSKAANDNDAAMAVLVIDVQQQFCDPEHSHARGNTQTVAAAERIAKTIPKFRNANIPIYAIYADNYSSTHPADIDWYKFRPAANDILIAKNQDSAFAGSKIKKILTRNGHRTLLACGFNRSACVRQTIVDARKAGFSVLLLRDLIGNDKYSSDIPKSKDFQFFQQQGIDIVSSKDVLKKISVAGSPTL